eukprot:scaffold533880_cov29-Prasinocladus_malaysianus.AAC.3
MNEWLDVWMDKWMHMNRCKTGNLCNNFTRGECSGCSKGPLHFAYRSLIDIAEAMGLAWYGHRLCSFGAPGFDLPDCRRAPDQMRGWYQ